MGQACAHSHLEPFRRLHISVQAHSKTVEVRILQSTVLLVVAHGIQIAGLPRASAHRQYVFCPECLVIADLVHPVLIPGSFRVGPYLSARLVDQLFPSVILVRVVVFRVTESAYRLAQLLRGIVGGHLHIPAAEFGVPERLPGNLHELFRIQKVIAWESPRCDSKVTFVGNTDLVLPTLLRGNDYDSVGTPRSVQSSSGSILEYGHSLYVGRIDGTQGSVIRYTIHHIQRRAGSVD